MYAPWPMGVKWCVVLVEVWPGMAPIVAESVSGLGVEHTPGQPAERETVILLPNDQRQHRILHMQKNVLPYALC